jgi:ubiquinone/menaquinone biosynthesis C-methylase UbiE
MKNNTLKNEVRSYWDNQACGTDNIDKSKFTKEYFDAIEEKRYSREPEILEFADFPSARGKTMLEVGLGAGTDFINWVRNGANAYGIDLTDESIAHVRHRLQLEGLDAKFEVGDSEKLPFKDNTFEFVYSWGVIHHTPDTPQAMREIYRVLQPGGKAKFMIYNRISMQAYFFWIKHAFLKGHWGKSINDVLSEYMESAGTKGYTINEVKDLLKPLPMKDLEVKTYYSYYDRLEKFNPVFRGIAKLVSLFVDKSKRGWFLTVEYTKVTK